MGDTSAATSDPHSTSSVSTTRHEQLTSTDAIATTTHSQPDNSTSRTNPETLRSYPTSTSINCNKTEIFDLANSILIISKSPVQQRIIENPLQNVEMDSVVGSTTEFVGVSSKSCHGQVVGNNLPSKMEQDESAIADPTNANSFSYPIFVKTEINAFESSESSRDAISPKSTESLTGIVDKTINHDQSNTPATSDFSNLEENDPLEEDSLESARVEKLANMGRRIVNISYLWNHLSWLSRKHECPIYDLAFVDYMDRGLRTKLEFSCRKCTFTASVWTDDNDGPLMGITQAAVRGSINTGIGHSGLQKMLSSMSVPGITSTTYRKHRDRLQRHYSNITDKIGNTSE